MGPEGGTSVFSSRQGAQGPHGALPEPGWPSWPISGPLDEEHRKDKRLCTCSRASVAASARQKGAASRALITEADLVPEAGFGRIVPAIGSVPSGFSNTNNPR